MNANLYTAAELCRKIYEVLSPLGYYPALTGGCLYKDGDRKDIDIVIYRNRQGHDSVDMAEVMHHLESIGFEVQNFHGFVTKAKFNDLGIDFFNPEDNGNYHQENEE